MNHPMNVPPVCGKCAGRDALPCLALGRGDPLRLEKLRRGHLVARRGRTMVREGERPCEAFVMVGGWAICFRMSPAGRRVLNVLLPGAFLTPELLGGANKPVDYSVETLTDASFCIFPATGLTGEQSKKPATASDAVSGLDSHLFASDSLVPFLKGRSAKERIAWFVLYLRERLRRRDPSCDLEFAFPLCRRDIANILDVTTPELGRALSALRKDRILEISDENIKILNYERLGELGKQCCS